MSDLDFNPLVLVQESIADLALQASEQIRVTQPGCVTCELLEGFRHAIHCYQMLKVEEQEPRVIEGLSELEQRLEGMDLANFECGNYSVLDGEQWTAVRTYASQLIAQFQWHQKTVVEYHEVQPRVWCRRSPRSND